MIEPLRIDPRTAALLVMDFQLAILDNYIGDYEAVVANTAGLVADARAVGMRVIHVVVGFRPGYPEVHPRNRIFSAVKENGMLLADDEGSRIHPALAPILGEPVVTKHRVSAFTGTDLDMLLKAGGTETLMLAGVSTAGVMLSTVRQGFDLDYRLIVASECCDDHDKALHAMLLEKVFTHHAVVAPSAVIRAAFS